MNKFMGLMLTLLITLSVGWRVFLVQPLTTDQREVFALAGVSLRNVQPSATRLKRDETEASINSEKH